MRWNAVEAVRFVVGLRSLAGRADLRFGRPTSGWERGVLRFLAVRQLLQATVLRRTGWHALGALVDLAHGASMVLLLAAAPRRYARIALGQILTAASLTALELAASSRRG